MPERYRVYDKPKWREGNLRIMPVDNYLLFYIPNHDADNESAMDALGKEMNDCGVFATKLDIENEMNRIGVFTVSFSCKPFRYSEAGQQEVSVASGDGFPLLHPGENTISYSGGITAVKVIPLKKE